MLGCYHGLSGLFVLLFSPAVLLRSLSPVAPPLFCAPPLSSPACGVSRVSSSFWFFCFPPCPPSSLPAPSSVRRVAPRFVRVWRWVLVGLFRWRRPLCCCCCGCWSPALCRVPCLVLVPVCCCPGWRRPRLRPRLLFAALASFWGCPVPRPSAFVRSLAFGFAFPAGGLVCVSVRPSSSGGRVVAVFGFSSLAGVRRFCRLVAPRVGRSLRVRGSAGCWLVSVPLPGSVSSAVFSGPFAGRLVFLSACGGGLRGLRSALALSGLLAV